MRLGTRTGAGESECGWRGAMLAAACSLGLFLFAAPAVAQTAPGAAPTVPEQDLCAVAGSVLRAVTGEPLKTAHVSLWPVRGTASGTSYGAQTDTAGHFSIQGVAPDRYSIFVERDGYVAATSPESAGQRANFFLALSPGETSRELVFRLVPWSVIAGRITDEDGEPLPGANVQTLRTSFNRGKRMLQPVGNGTADDRGEFRIWGLRPGHYYVRVTYMDRRNRSASAQEEREERTQTAYAPSFYPGTPDPSQAVALEVRAGEDIPGVDFRLLPSHAVTVRGRVFDAIHGQPLRRCCMFFSSSENEANFSSIRSAELDPTNGTFEVPEVTPGIYQVTALTTVDGRQYFGRRKIDVGNTDVEGVEVVINRGGDVRGRVSVEGQGTVDLTRIMVNLVSSDQTMGIGIEGGRVGEVKSDGTFTIAGMSEGSYEVSLPGRWSGAYLKSARVNGQDVLEAGVTVGAGGIKDLLEIVLSTAGAVVDGVATGADGQAVGGARVVLLPQGEKRKFNRLYLDTTTDQYGKFAFRDVTPGEYKVFSWERIDYGAWHDPDLLATIESKGVRVSVEENGHVSVELQVLPGVAPDSPSQ